MADVVAKPALVLLDQLIQIHRVFELEHFDGIFVPEIKLWEENLDVLDYVLKVNLLVSLLLVKVRVLCKHIAKSFGL